MKQHIETVEAIGSDVFEREVNKLLDKGYKLQNSSISHRCVGTYDEYSVFQAILLLETEE